MQMGLFFSLSITFAQYKQYAIHNVCTMLECVNVCVCAGVCVCAHIHIHLCLHTCGGQLSTFRIVPQEFEFVSVIVFCLFVVETGFLTGP